MRRYGHIVCVGEPMLCVNPTGIPAVGTCTVTATGSELLTACATSRLGQDASLVTALPDSHLAAPVEAAAAAAGVTLKALYDASPLAGIATLHLPPIGTSASGGPRRTEPVLQGTSCSAFVRECSGTAFCWPTLLSGVDVLHTSGSSLALGPGVRNAWRAAVEAADSSVAISVAVDQTVALCRHDSDEEEREQRDAWVKEVAKLAKAGRLSLLTVGAHDLDRVCSAFGLHRSGGTSSAQLTEQVEGLATQLRELRERTAGGKSSALGPLVAAQFATRAPAAGGAENSRGGQQITRWSTVAVAQGRSDDTGIDSISTGVFSATTEHVPVKYTVDLCLLTNGSSLTSNGAAAAAAASIDQLNLGNGTRHDGRIGARNAASSGGGGGDAAFVGGLLSALVEQGHWWRRRQQQLLHGVDRWALDESKSVPLSHINERDLRAIARRGDITASYAELLDTDTAADPSGSTRSNPAASITRDRVIQAEIQYEERPAMLFVGLEHDSTSTSNSHGSSDADKASDAQGKGVLTGSSHLPGFGGGSDLNALNPLTPGAPVSSLGDPLAMLRGFGAVAETVGLFSAGAAGAGLSKGLRDLDKIRTSLTAVAASLNVSEQALLNALTNAVPELAKYVPLLSMLPGGGGTISSASSAFAGIKAVPAPEVVPSTAPAAAQQYDGLVVERPSTPGTLPDSRPMDRGQFGQEQVHYVASADDEMERVWRTESVSHAISRSRILLPVSMPVDPKHLGELKDAGITAVLLTLPRGRHRDDVDDSMAADVVEEGRQLGLCVGVEAQTSQEMAAAAQAGARFVLLMEAPGHASSRSSQKQEAEMVRETEEAGGVSALLTEAARMSCMRRMPVIPTVRDSGTLDKLVSQHGVATILWDCSAGSGPDAVSAEATSVESLMAEIGEVHRDYGGTLRFIVGCDAASADVIVSTAAAPGSHSALAAVLGVRPSSLVDDRRTGSGVVGDSVSSADAVLSAVARLRPD